MIQKPSLIMSFKSKLYCKLTSCQLVPTTLVMPFKMISLNFYEKEWEFDCDKTFCYNDYD